MSEKMKVLIVEDEEKMHFLYKQFFGNKDYEIFSANDFEEIKNYENQEFDYLITDGLFGNYLEVLKGVNAKNKIVVTNDEITRLKCINKGIKCLDKLNVFEIFEEIFK